MATRKYILCGEQSHQRLIARELMHADPSSEIVYRAAFRPDHFAPGDCLVVALNSSEGSVTDANLVLGAACEKLPAAVVVFDRGARLELQNPPNEHGRIFRDVLELVKWVTEPQAAAAA